MHGGAGVLIKRPHREGAIVLAKSETRLTSAGARICLSIMMCAQLYANDPTVIMLFQAICREKHICLCSFGFL